MYKAGDSVWVKSPGYPWWPAWVINEEDCPIYRPRKTRNPIACIQYPTNKHLFNIIWDPKKIKPYGGDYKKRYLNKGEALFHKRGTKLQQEFDSDVCATERVLKRRVEAGIPIIVQQKKAPKEADLAERLKVYDFRDSSEESDSGGDLSTSDPEEQARYRQRGLHRITRLIDFSSDSDPDSISELQKQSNYKLLDSVKNKLSNLKKEGYSPSSSETDSFFSDSIDARLSPQPVEIKVEKVVDIKKEAYESTYGETGGLLQFQFGKEDCCLGDEESEIPEFRVSILLSKITYKNKNKRVHSQQEKGCGNVAKRFKVSPDTEKRLYAEKLNESSRFVMRNSNKNRASLSPEETMGSPKTNPEGTQSRSRTRSKTHLVLSPPTSPESPANRIQKESNVRRARSRDRKKTSDTEPLKKPTSRVTYLMKGALHKSPNACESKPPQPSNSIQSQDVLKQNDNYESDNDLPTVVSPRKKHRVRNDTSIVKIRNISQSTEQQSVDTEFVEHMESTEPTEQFSEAITDTTDLTKQFSEDITDTTDLTKQFSEDITDISDLTKQFSEDITDISDLTKQYSEDITDPTKQFSEDITDSQTVSIPVKIPMSLLKSEPSGLYNSDSADLTSNGKCLLNDPIKNVAATKKNNTSSKWKVALKNPVDKNKTQENNLDKAQEQNTTTQINKKKRGRKRASSFPRYTTKNGKRPCHEVEGDTDSKVTMTPNRIQSSHSNCLSFDSNLDKDACEPKEEDPDDDDFLPSGLFSEKVQKDTISPGDLVWAKMKIPIFWPAVVKSVYMKKKAAHKVTLIFIKDINTDHSGDGEDPSQPVTLGYNKKKIVKFGSPSYQEFKDQGLASIYAKQFKEAVVKADSYLFSIMHGNAKNALELHKKEFGEYSESEGEGDMMEGRVSPLTSRVEDILEDTSEKTEEADLTQDMDENDSLIMEIIMEGDTKSKQLQKTKGARKERARKLIDFIKSEKSVAYLKKIYDGSIKSERHDMFHKPGKTQDERNHLKMQGVGPIDDEDQLEELMNFLISFYKQQSRDSTNISYISEVLMPEAIVFSLMKVTGYTKKKAEEMFRKGVRRTKEESRMIENEMLTSSKNINPDDALLYKEKLERTAKMFQVQL